MLIDAIRYGVFCGQFVHVDLRFTHNSIAFCFSNGRESIHTLNLKCFVVDILFSNLRLPSLLAKLRIMAMLFNQMDTSITFQWQFLTFNIISNLKIHTSSLADSTNCILFVTKDSNENNKPVVFNRIQWNLNNCHEYIRIKIFIYLSLQTFFILYFCKIIFTHATIGLSFLFLFKINLSYLILSFTM